MSCPYQYYIDDKQYLAKLYCKLNDKACIYSKRCDNVHRFIPMDNQEECYLYNMENQKNIPTGSYYIKVKRLNSQKDKLYVYVDIDNTTVKILTNFAEINQDYIYVKKVDGKYVVSLDNNFPITKVVEEIKETKNEDVTTIIEEKPLTTYTTKKTTKKRTNKTKG